MNAKGIAALTLGLLTGCTSSHVVEEPITPDPVTTPDDDDAPTDEGVMGDLPTCSLETDAVDLLFVVDDSRSMDEEQASLAIAIPQLVRALTTGDADGDGAEAFAPVGSLQVGVVSTDMGTGGFRVPTCDDADYGDDGVLRTGDDASRPECAMLDPIATYEAGEPVGPYADAVSCLTATGTDGCGFEQQLEAMLKAITPSTSDVEFVAGSRGHADGDNAGFIRPDAVLAVVVVSDEEDCSIADPELFDPASTRYEGDLNLRCFRHPEAVHPVDRFVDGLLAAKRDPHRIVYATIAGVPTDLAGASFIDVLADPRMQERIDPSFGTRLVPSCDVPGRGLAFPPRRLVELAYGLGNHGAHVTAQSICQQDFTRPVRAIVEKIGEATRRTCL